MWQAAFVIQRCLFPMIKVLHWGTSPNVGGQANWFITFIIHQTNKAIQKSMELLKDLKYFQTARPSDANDVEGIDLDDG
jgi:hypothetical protein